METNKSDKFSLLDLFQTPSWALPETLPELLVAPLEAGGRPLLSMPNMPHLVYTVRSTLCCIASRSFMSTQTQVQDCVMIEQRRILKLFMDEVHYFLERTWNCYFSITLSNTKHSNTKHSNHRYHEMEDGTYFV